MSSQRVRERSLDKSIHYSGFISSNGTKRNPSFANWKGRQKTASSGHRKGRDGRYHEGGEFFTFRDTAEIPTRSVKIKGTGLSKALLIGPIHTAGLPSDYGMAKVPSQDSSYLDPVGAEAISIIDPMNPNAQTGIALGEIVNDRYIPVPAISLWRQRTQVAKAAGSEYLNAVFGWMPLVRDMKNTAQSVMDGNTIIDNYRAASGTKVHREFSFDDDVDTTEEDISVGHAVYSASNSEPDFHVSGTIAATRIKTTTTKRWFSGSFTYHANTTGNSVLDMMNIGSEAEKLYGLALTPDLVWELTPWSWAIDWFSNAGNVISNINSFALAGLVMHYGYIMEESITKVTIIPGTTGLTGVTGTTPPVSRTYCTKRRREANPFGFGVSWDGLSPTQLAITAALGITRLR
jgi:hypothetical protein